MANGNGKKKPNGRGSKKAKAKAKAKPAPKAETASDDQSDSTPERRHGAEHLKPHWWKPGQSGNPKGRPKKPSLWDAVCRRLRFAAEQVAKDVPRHDEDGKVLRPPALDEIADALLEMLIRGDREAATLLKEMGDRLDGRVPVKAELTGKDGDAITIRHARDDIVSRIASQIARSRAGVDISGPN